MCYEALVTSPPRNARVSKHMVVTPAVQSNENFAALSAPVSFSLWVRKRLCDQRTLKSKPALLCCGEMNIAMEANHLDTVVFSIACYSFCLL